MNAEQQITPTTSAPGQACIAAAQALEAARHWHAALPALAAFCPWPEDIRYAGLMPEPLPAHHLIGSHPGATKPQSAPLLAALQAFAPHAHWQHGYTAQQVGQRFLDTFCWCELAGPAGHFTSHAFRLTLAYWGPGLYYPRHHHLAEEAYSVVSGSAVFHADGAADATLGPGDTRLHAANQPHAMTTLESPVLTLVLWRPPGLDGPFRLSDQAEAENPLCTASSLLPNGSRR